jgi:hypothetical protein
MSTIQGKLFALIISLACIGLTVPAWGAFSENYGNYYGSTVDFLQVSEATQTEDVALYKAPWLNGNGQLFFPSLFVSESENGSSDTTSGTLTMTLSAHDGYQIDRVIVKEIGNATLTGTGNSGTSATLDGTLNVLGESDSLHLDYSLPGNTYETFNESLVIDFGDGVTEASFELINILNTTSQDGTTAKLRKQIIDETVMLEVYTNPVPIPGAVWLLGSGLMAVIGIRRRKVS